MIEVGASVKNAVEEPTVNAIVMIEPPLSRNTMLALPLVEPATTVRMPPDRLASATVLLLLDTK